MSTAAGCNKTPRRATITAAITDDEMELRPLVLPASTHPATRTRDHGADARPARSRRPKAPPVMPAPKPGRRWRRGGRQGMAMAMPPCRNAFPRGGLVSGPRTGPPQRQK